MSAYVERLLPLLMEGIEFWIFTETINICSRVDVKCFQIDSKTHYCQQPREPKGRVYNPLLQQPPLPFSPLFMDIDRLTNPRHAYEDLERHVRRVLNTQVGDNDRLAEIQNEVLLYNEAVDQVHRIQPTKRQNNLNSPSDVACPPLLT